MNAFLKPLGRGAYAIWGFVLVAVKYNIDRLIAMRGGVQAFLPWENNWPSGAKPIWSLSSENSSLLLTIALTAIPFAVVGLVLTMRRLRSAGWSPWLVILFFAPVVNLIFFAILCVVPPADVPRPVEESWFYGWMRWVTPRNHFANAAIAVLATAIGTSALAWLSVVVVGSYGFGVFYALPFVAGFVSVLLCSVHGPISGKVAAHVSLATVLVSGLLLFAVAVEGIICLLMAAPIAVVMALLGAVFAFFIQRQSWRSRQSTGAMCAGIAVLPLLFIADSTSQPPLRSCTTEVVIAAPPAEVWGHVVQFSRIPPPREWVFSTGIAYPIEAVIEGRGVGAVRLCRFSTGDFVEPITRWEEPHRLAFSVQSQPEPMREISPYAHIHPPHLEGYLVSERGEFLLEKTPEGGTLLRGTTWYRQRLWPQSYWGQFTDYLIHAIHLRVLDHIRTETESSTSATADGASATVKSAPVSVSIFP